MVLPLVLALPLLLGSTWSFEGRVIQRNVDDFKQVLVTDRAPVIILNSPGGNLLVGLEIARLIKKHGRVICVANNYVASAAFLIFQACQTRIAHAGSLFMIHPLSVEFGLDENGKPITETYGYFQLHGLIDRLWVNQRLLELGSCRRAKHPKSCIQDLRKERSFGAIAARTEGLVDWVIP